MRAAAPVAHGVGLPWDVAVEDGVAAIAAARARHGDTFVVDSGGDHYLFTFSPTGVESFYALPEDVASKGLADYLMLKRKLPEEIFAGRRTLPGSLFRRDDVSSYLSNLDRALHANDDELGRHGSIDVFDLTRRLGHRMGLASWGGAGFHRRRDVRTAGPRLRCPGRLRRVRSSRCHGGGRRLETAGRAGRIGRYRRRHRRCAGPR